MKAWERKYRIVVYGTGGSRSAAGFTNDFTVAKRRADALHAERGARVVVIDQHADEVR